MKNQEKVFYGKLQKIQLTTNHLYFGPEPAPNEEVEQHLTITADGRVWLSRYRYGNEIKYTLARMERKKLSESQAEEIIQAFEIVFKSWSLVLLATDVGMWSLDLTNTEGEVFHFSGSLIYTESLGKLSELLRDRLEIENLFAFTG